MSDTVVEKVGFWFIRTSFDAKNRYPKLEAPKGFRVTPIFTSCESATTYLIEHRWRYAFEIQACETEPKLAVVIMQLMANNFTHFAVDGVVDAESLIPITKPLNPHSEE